MFKIGDKVRVVIGAYADDKRVGKTGTIKRLWETVNGRPSYYVIPDQFEANEMMFAYWPFHEREFELIGEEDAATDLFADAEQLGEPIVVPELDGLQLTGQQLKNAHRKE